MSFLGVDLSDEAAIGVAVSGGGDSLALALLLAEWCKGVGVRLHAITVDHGLRPEAADEAKYVAKILKPFGVVHKTLVWSGEKPKTGLQEAARDARYRLMTDYCQQSGISYLFVAHHGQDQIETILFRMAKGTGVDGLVGMRPVQRLETGLVLLRPLLPVTHDALLATCREHKIGWIEDPSNQNNRYARVRIRNVADVLEKEGLTPERMAHLSARLSSSINLIDYLIEDRYKSMIILNDTERIEINYNELLGLPEEGRVRLLRKIISDLHPTKKYPVRLEDIERLVSRMGENFKGATLGGCVFRKKKGALCVALEAVKH